MEVYKYRIKPRNVIITLKAEGPNSDGVLEYEGKSFNKKLVVFQLEGKSDAFGHSFSSKSATPIDLDFALKQTFGKDKVEVLGEKITSYDPEIPEGAVT